jgi:uncharacterized protein (DUF2236 family)
VPTAAPAPPGPDSLLWRLGFPRTSLLLAARALLLQVAHPVVGAGVRDFSAFRADPWGRLDRTLSSLMVQLFGAGRAGGEARRLHQLHRGITGTGFDGRPYRAAQPDAWAWVHLANADTMLVFHARFGRPLGPDDQERYWADWRRAGLVLGIRPGLLPGSVTALRARIDEVVAGTLGDNETVRTLLATLRLDDVGPPTAALPRPVWDALRPVGRFLLRDATIGTLPPALRSKLGLDWSVGEQRRLERTALVVRAAGEALPDRVLHYPAAYRAVQAARRHERRSRTGS